MSDNKVEKLGIAGSGTIACGLAVAAASAGELPVTLRARSDESAQKAQAAIAKQCSRLDDGDAVLARVKVTTDLGALADCTFAIEAVAEEVAVKAPLLAELNRVLAADAVIGSTTSSLSVTELAGHSGRPRNFVGFHVFNPVPRMKLIEIAYSPDASASTKERSRALCEALDKTGVEVPDTAGFVVNRLLFPYLFDAATFMQDSGLSAESVDTCMKLGAGHPMGPLALLDYVGLDVSIAIGESIGVTIPKNARELAEAGKLGRKSGEGFYKY